MAFPGGWPVFFELAYFALVAAVARHRVNTPQLHVGSPDAHWRGAALMEQIVLRPLQARNRFFAYGGAVAYIRASGESVDTTAYELWRDLVVDIRALRLAVYDMADRLRSMGLPE